MSKKTIKDINEYKGSTVNPMNFPDTVFELYSVPSFEQNYPEIIKGSEIGSSKVTVQKNDILVCKINPRINRVWKVKHNTEHQLLASSEWIIIRSPQNNADYLKWYFQSPVFRTYMNSALTGIGGSLTRAQPKQVANYPVPLPPLETQKQIAATLDKATHTIDLCNAILEKLDLLVKARFVEMFGDPVSNSKGWNKVPLGECLISIENGKSFVCSNENRVNDNPAILKLSAVTYGIYLPNENKALLDDSLFDEKSEVKECDLLFTRKNTPELVGMSAYVYNTPPKLMMPDLIFRLNTKSTCNKIYLWKLINHDLFRSCIQSISNGSAKSMSNISKERLSNLFIPLPPLELQEQFAAFVAQTDKSKAAVKALLQKAETLKKALMQEYFG